MNTADNTNRPRRPFRLWLGGIAVGTLGAILIAPATGWIAREHLGILLGIRNTAIERASSNLWLVGSVPNPSHAPTAGDDGRTESPVLKSHPRDFPLHLAAAMRIAEERRVRRMASGAPAMPPVSIGTEIRALKDRFADRPGLYAAAIRMDTMGVVRIVRPEVEAISGSPVHRPDRVSDPDSLATFDRDCEAGERLEPDNGYFPAMRAVGYFAANRDRDALESLVQAGTKPSWDEHLADEVTGKWALAEAESGRANAVTRTAIAAGILFPHLSQLRSATQLATFKAMQMEQAGKSAEGAEIRIALMRIGDLMRVHCTSLIGNLVGIACTNIAVSRPGGAPLIKPREEVGHGLSARERDEPTRTRFGLLASYWRQHGLAQNISVAEQRIESGVRVRHQISEMLPASPFNESVLQNLVLLWCTGTVVLTDIWWLLVCGSLAAIFLSRRQHAGRERMPRSGPFVLSVAAVLFVLFCGHAMYQQNLFIQTQVQILAAFQGMSGEHHVTGVQVLNPCVLFAVPGILGLMSLIVSVVRRVPLRVGIAQGFSRVGLPLACVLLLGFCTVCVATAQYEERVSAGLEHVLAHEGRYLSRLTSQQWPGVVE